MLKRRPELVEHALELFAPLGEIRVKAMFGGWGFYCDGQFFALIADDILFLKADDASESAFRTVGSTPFAYQTKDGRSVKMAYWSAPEEALESPQAMHNWARLALAAAWRANPAKRKASPQGR